MADDIAFDDFGDFASAFPPTVGANGASVTQGTTSGVNQVNSKNEVDLFPSLPAPTTTSGDNNASLDFASFDVFANHAVGVGGGGGIPDFGQFDVANVNLAELKIPSPAHNPDVHVHMVGGVAFDIPPILDDDFSDPGSPPAVVTNQLQVELQNNLFSVNTTKPVDENESLGGVSLSFPNLVPPRSGPDDKKNLVDDDLGDFELSLTLKPDAVVKPSTEQPNTGSSFPVLGDNSLSTFSAVGSDSQGVSNFRQSQTVWEEPRKSDEFGGVRTSTDVDKTELPAFANFGDSYAFVNTKTISASEVKPSESKSTNEPVLKESQTGQPSDDFAGFADFQSSEATKTSQENTQFSDFGTLSDAQGGDFDAFGDFQTLTSSHAAPLPTASTSIKGDEFGAFSNITIKDDESKSGTFSAFADREGKGDNFGAFAGNENEFGAFAEGTNKVDEFGAFADNSSKGGEFGAFADSSSKDDEFGDFSSTGDSTFGNFTSTATVPTPSASEDRAKHKVSVHLFASRVASFPDLLPML